MKFWLASSLLVASASASFWFSSPTVGEVPPVPTVSAPLVEEKLFEHRTLQVPSAPLVAEAEETEALKEPEVC